MHPVKLLFGFIKLFLPIRLLLHDFVCSNRCLLLFLDCLDVLLLEHNVNAALSSELGRNFVLGGRAGRLLLDRRQLCFLVLLRSGFDTKKTLSVLVCRQDNTWLGPHVEALRGRHSCLRNFLVSLNSLPFLQVLMRIVGGQKLGWKLLVCCGCVVTKLSSLDLEGLSCWRPRKISLPIRTSRPLSLKFK